MNEDKGFSLLIKIVVIAILMALVLIVVLVYSNGLDKKPVKLELDQNQEKVVTQKVAVNQKQLQVDYQSDLIAVISTFNGDYKHLQTQIIAIVVPMGFQELHLQLVLALNPILYEDSINITKERLQNIANNYEWLKVSLENNILNIK
jgi:hypothetical protein